MGVMTVAWPVRLVVGAAMLATIGLALILPFFGLRVVDELATRPGWPVRALLRFGPAVVTACVLIACFARRHRTSPWLVAIVCVGIVHVGLVVLACGLWGFAARRVDLAQFATPAWNPSLVLVASLLSGVLLVVAWRAGSERRAASLEVLRRLVGFLLLHWLLLGTTVPLVVCLEPWATDADVARHMLHAVALPTLVACGWLLLAHRVRLRPAPAVWPLALVVAVGAAFAPGEGQPEALRAYSHAAQLLIAEGWLTLVAIAALGISHWRALAGARRAAARDLAFGGIVDAERGARVAWLRNRGWLSGFSTELADFRVRTPSGSLGVPRSACLIVPMPLWSAHMPVGSRVPVLRAGDPVVVRGYEDAVQGAPYRSAQSPVATTRGVVVTVLRQGGTPWDDAVLLMWRPLLLYVGVATAIALPALVSVLRSVC